MFIFCAASCVINDDDDDNDPERLFHVIFWFRARSFRLRRFDFQDNQVNSNRGILSVKR